MGNQSRRRQKKARAYAGKAAPRKLSGKGDMANYIQINRLHFCINKASGTGNAFVAGAGFGEMPVPVPSNCLD
jgi:hypothetical protein